MQSLQLSLLDLRLIEGIVAIDLVVAALKQARPSFPFPFPFLQQLQRHRRCRQLHGRQLYRR